MGKYKQIHQASAVMYSMNSREYDVAGTASPSMPPPTVHTERQGRTVLAYLLRNMSQSKQARETYISRIEGSGEYSAKQHCNLNEVITAMYYITKFFDL